MDGGIEQGGVIGANSDGVPLGLCTAIVDIGQVGTAHSCGIANGSNADRNGYAGQTAAIHKHRLTNGCDAISEINIRQAGAAVEQTIAEIGNAARNIRIGQASTRKCAHVNRGDAVGDGYLVQIRAARKGILANSHNTVRNLHAGQAGAVMECIVSQRRDAVFDNQRLHLRLIRHPWRTGTVGRNCIIIHWSVALNVQRLCWCVIPPSHAGVFTLEMDVGIEKGFVASVNGNGVPLSFCAVVIDIGQFGTTGERKITKPNNTDRNRHAGQAGTGGERRTINTSNTGGNRHTGQAGTVFKRRIANTGNTVRNGHAGQVSAAMERMITNTGDTGRNGHAS